MPGGGAHRNSTASSRGSSISTGSGSGSRNDVRAGGDGGIGPVVELSQEVCRVKCHRLKEYPYYTPFVRSSLLS